MPRRNPPNNPSLPKLFFQRNEAAYALGISLGSIDVLIARKELNTRRFGTRVLIPAADVQKVAAKIMREDMLEGVKG